VNPPVRVVNETNGVTLAVDGEMAVSLGSRLRGLLGRDRLPAGRGLVFPGCSMIHMFFMRFPIDVLFLDAQHRVCSLREALKPWVVAWGGFRARDTIELPVGAIAETGTQKGHVVRWE